MEDQEMTKESAMSVGFSFFIAVSVCVILANFCIIKPQDKSRHLYSLKRENFTKWGWRFRNGVVYFTALGIFFSALANMM